MKITSSESKKAGVNADDCEKFSIFAKIFRRKRKITLFYESNQKNHHPARWS